MAVIKIKKPREPRSGGRSSSNTAAEDEPKLKKIRLSSRKEEGTKLKINLKKKLGTEEPLKKSGSVVKLKLGGAKKEKVHRAPRLRLKPIRIPGEGYDSEASDLEDDPLIESGVILRVLPDVQVDFIKNSIESGDYSGISIKWKGERHAILKLNNVSYGAILVDLPTIIEVNKSVDRKNLFKTFDVTQMLVCVKPISSEEELFTMEAPDTEDLISKHYKDYQDDINELKVKLFKASNNINLHSESEAKNMEQLALKKYHYKHGLTPPLYNVRNRRFRRTMNPDEFDYAEKIVDMLLKDDAEAEDVKFDLIAPVDAPEKSTITSKPSFDNSIITKTQPEVNVNSTISSTTNAEDDEDLDLDEAFLSDDEEVDTTTKPSDSSAGLFGDAEDGEDGDEVDQDNGEDEDDDDDDDDEEEEEEEEEGPGEQDGNVDEKRQHTELLQDELNELVTTLEHTKDKLQKATNPLLKSRFVESIKKLEKEVELKKKQLSQTEDNNSNDADDDTKGQPADVDDIEDEDEEDEDEDEDEEDEDEEEDEEEEAAANDDNNNEQIPENNEELDQNDLDMMMLFGAEGDE